MTKNEKFSLDVGCSNVTVAEVSINVKKHYLRTTLRPTVLADVRYLPFKERVFERVYFLDVIEHLTVGDEYVALSEIRRVLEGELILTTPNRKFLYTCLDPAFYIKHHRHFSENEIARILKEAGFREEKIFTRGGFWHATVVLARAICKYIFRPKVPLWLIRLYDNEYQEPRRDGYTIFCVAHN